METLVIAILAILVVQTIAVSILVVGLCMAVRLHGMIVQTTETIMQKVTHFENAAKTWTANPLNALLSNGR